MESMQVVYTVTANIYGYVGLRENPTLLNSISSQVTLPHGVHDPLAACLSDMEDTALEMYADDGTVGRVLLADIRVSTFTFHYCIG